MQEIKEGNTIGKMKEIMFGQRESNIHNIEQAKCALGMIDRSPSPAIIAATPWKEEKLSRR
jgi:fructose/tagatose bisphosphate aldolase